jgi:hypothetical protein
MSVQKNLAFLTSLDVEKARSTHETMVARLMKGPSGTHAAMRRLEVEFGLNYWKQWKLRYRCRATTQFIWQLERAYVNVLRYCIQRDNILINEITYGWSPVRQDDAGLTEALAHIEAYKAMRFEH